MNIRTYGKQFRPEMRYPTMYQLFISFHVFNCTAEEIHSHSLLPASRSTMREQWAFGIHTNTSAFSKRNSRNSEWAQEGAVVLRGRRTQINVRDAHPDGRSEIRGTPKQRVRCNVSCLGRGPLDTLHSVHHDLWKTTSLAAEI